ITHDAVASSSGESAGRSSVRFALARIISFPPSLGSSIAQSRTPQEENTSTTACTTTLSWRSSSSSSFVARTNCRCKKYKKRNPFFGSSNRKGVKRRHKKKIKRKKSHKGRKNGSIQSSCTCQHQHYKQVGKGNIRYAWVEVQCIYYCGYQQRTNDSHGAIAKIASPPWFTLLFQRG